MIPNPPDDDCVLIVDDQPTIRETMRELVEMAGCRSLLAADGEEALRVLEEHRPCLVILDLMMPVMTGAEMLRELEKRPHLADLEIVIVTSAPELAPPGRPVLCKPVNIDQLWGYVRGACRCAPSGPAAHTRTTR